MVLINLHTVNELADSWHMLELCVIVKVFFFVFVAVLLSKQR